MNGCQTLGSEDMISELPDALLLHILSLLPKTKDAVATSVLSKRWRFLCKMMPNLRFCHGHTRGLERFSKNVCRCLLSHQAPVLQSLHLTVCFESGSMDTGVMNLLMGVAFGLHVRELKLLVYSPNELFKFPTSLLNCGKLETLKLDFGVLLDVPFPVCLRSLRTLRLFGVRFQDNESVVNLLSGCSILENLEVKMYMISDVKTFTIDVPSLQSLTLVSHNYEHESAYAINTPYLKYLTLKGLLDDDSCLIEDTPELVEAHINRVCGVIYEKIHGSLTSVKRLSLKISLPLDPTKFPTNRIFNQLVYLEMHTCVLDWWNLLMIMFDSSPNLQVLKIICDWFRKKNMGWSQPKYVPECLANRLDTLVWEDYEGEREDEREGAQYMLRNASRLETATFFKPDIQPGKRLQRLKELESVVWASKSCQLMFKDNDITWES